MTNQFRPSVVDEKVSPAFIKGTKARRYSDGFETNYKVDLIPQTGQGGKHCSSCNCLAVWLYTPIKKGRGSVGLTFWRCNMCLMEEEREIIRHTYYLLGDVSTDKDTYGKRLYTKV